MRCLLRSRSVSTCFHLHMVAREGSLTDPSSGPRVFGASMECCLRSGLGPICRDWADKLGVLPANSLSREIPFGISLPFMAVSREQSEQNRRELWFSGAVLRHKIQKLAFWDH